MPNPQRLRIAMRSSSLWSIDVRFAALITFIAVAVCVEACSIVSMLVGIG